MTRTWDEKLDPYITALPQPIKALIAVPVFAISLVVTAVVMAGMVGIALVTGARR